MVYLATKMIFHTNGLEHTYLGLEFSLSVVNVPLILQLFVFSVSSNPYSWFILIHISIS